MPRGGRRLGAGRKPKTLVERQRGGYNRKTLLEHVRALSFRLGRHDELLATDDSLLHSPSPDDHEEDRIVYLAAIQLFARAAVDDDERAEALHAFAALATAPPSAPFTSEAWWPFFGLFGELGWDWEDDEILVLSYKNADPGAEERAFPVHRARAGRRLTCPRTEAPSDAAS